MNPLLLQKGIILVYCILAVYCRTHSAQDYQLKLRQHLQTR